MSLCLLPQPSFLRLAGLAKTPATASVPVKPSTLPSQDLPPVDLDAMRLRTEQLKADKQGDKEAKVRLG